MLGSKYYYLRFGVALFAVEKVYITPGADDLHDLYDLYDLFPLQLMIYIFQGSSTPGLYDLAHVARREPDNLHDRGIFPGLDL